MMQDKVITILRTREYFINLSDYSIGSKTPFPEGVAESW